MSDKKNTAPTTGSTAPETSVKNTVSSGSGDSNLELQELLRKYLPEFAEESSKKAPSAEEEEYAPEETADESLTEDVPVKEEEPEVITVVEEEDSFEPKKKKGLFARLFSSKKKEEENADVEAPDGALFEQISAETSDAAEQAEDDDIRIAESSEEDDDVRRQRQLKKFRPKPHRNLKTFSRRRKRKRHSKHPLRMTISAGL